LIGSDDNGKHTEVSRSVTVTLLLLLEA